jgi:hypothetical protein
MPPSARRAARRLTATPTATPSTSWPPCATPRSSRRCSRQAPTGQRGKASWPRSSACRRWASCSAVPRVLPGRCLDHAQIRRHRPWARNQQAVLRDDGRRHNGRERARTRIDIHDPIAAHRGGRQGSNVCRSSPLRRGRAEALLGPGRARRGEGVSRMRLAIARCGNRRRRGICAISAIPACRIAASLLATYCTAALGS